MGEIGGMVQEVAESHGFNTIHNLCGHQIAQNNLHCGISVPNYKNMDSRAVEDGMEFAVEPFFTRGVPKVKSCGPSNIVHLVNDKPVRDPIAKKVLMYIREHYPTLPFSKRWLVKDIVKNLRKDFDSGFDIKRVNYAIKILKQNGILMEYDALASVDGEFVSQYEDVVVFHNNQKTIITRL